MKENEPSSLDAALARPVVAEFEPGHFCCSVWQNVSILIWADRATKEALGRIQRVTKRMIEGYPNGHSNVAFVLDGVKPPTPEAREIFTRLYNERVSHLKCLAVILEGTGFWASTLRSSVTNMQLEARRTTAIGQYTSIEELATWMAPIHAERTGVTITALQLRVALRAARADGVPGVRSEH
jgi:hypothetical protein